MLKPISFQVLRQALDKMGIPLPIMRVLSTYKLPDGTLTAEYLFTWPTQAVAEYLRSLYPSPVADLHGVFRVQLQASFAEDVQVVALYLDNQPGIVQALLHVRVTPHDRQLPLSTAEDGWL